MAARDEAQQRHARDTQPDTCVPYAWTVESAANAAVMIPIAPRYSVSENLRIVPHADSGARAGDALESRQSSSIT